MVTAADGPAFVRVSFTLFLVAFDTGAERSDNFGEDFGVIEVTFFGAAALRMIGAVVLGTVGAFGFRMDWAEDLETTLQNKSYC